MSKNLQNNPAFQETLRQLRAENRKKRLIKAAIITATVLVLLGLAVGGVAMIYRAGNPEILPEATDGDDTTDDLTSGQQGGSQNGGQSQKPNNDKEDNKQEEDKDPSDSSGEDDSNGTEDDDHNNGNNPDDSQDPAVKKTVVCIDPGHGFGNSVGTIDKGTGSGTPYYELTGKYESELNLAVALELKRLLIEQGYEVVILREEESTEHVTIGERVKRINATNADLLISIHANSYTSESVKGARVYYSTNHYEEAMLGSGKCRKFAYAIADALNGTEGASLSNVTVGTHDDIGVIKSSNMPAVLVETCFLTSPEDAQLAASEDWATVMATGLCKGIKMYMPATKE